MIRDLGNCGNTEKLVRIFKAWESAKENQCAIVIVLDEVVYGENNVFRFPSKAVQEFKLSANKNEIHLIHDNEVCATYPWWDIVKVNVLW